jgi:hypothetical protein
MTMLFGGLLFLCFFVFCIGKMATYKHKVYAIKQTPKPKAVKPKEKPIETVIKEFRDGVKADERAEEKKWEATYLAGLPLHEHPDFIEVSPEDEVDILTIKNYGGDIVMESKTYYNKQGYQYSARPDYITQTAKINHKSLTWTVPLSQIKK